MPRPFMQGSGGASDAEDVAFTPAGTIEATDVQAAIEEVAQEAGASNAPDDADYLVGTANGSLSAEIVVGTSPGGELGGTWGSPTVDATHSGSSHAATQSAAEATAAAALSAHDSDTTSVHGIANTAVLATTSTKLDDFATPDDNTDLNASTSAHGLLKKLDNSASHFLDGQGAWSTPDHGSLGGLSDNDHTQYVLKATAQSFSVGALLLGGPPSNGFYMVWRAPFACTVTNVRAHFDAGTSVTVNARVNQTSDFLSSDFTHSTANSWGDGGSVQNTSIAAGDDIEVELVGTSGAVTKANIQVDLTRALA